MQITKPGHSLNAKLILGFLIVALPAVAIVGGISFYALRELTIANRDLQEISRSFDAVRDLQGHVGRALVPLSDFIAYEAPGQRPVFDALMGEIQAQLQSCGNSACHGASGQPGQMAQGLMPYFDAIKARASTVFDEQAVSSERIGLYREISEQERDVSGQLERMSSALLVRVEALQQKSEGVYGWAWRLILAAIFIVCGLAVLIAYFLSRHLARPLNELMTGTRHLTMGDLDHRVTVKERGEIGELARSFNAMAGEIGQHRQRLEAMVQARTAELQQAHASLSRSEKLASIGLLASGVAHELNNPLTSVLMNVSLLMEDLEDRPEVRRELTRVADDVLRCKRIIDDLRDFSRRRELEIGLCDLNELLGDVLNLISRQLELQQITLVKNLCEEGMWVPCDSNRMRQVLMNILANSIQAMPGGGVITLATAVEDGHAVITIADSGPGIPGDIRTKIFDPFFTTKSDGTGLGLSIVYGIMEEHGGKVDIESCQAGNAGSGTAVRLLLPIKVSATGRHSARSENA